MLTQSDKSLFEKKADRAEANIPELSPRGSMNLMEVTTVVLEESKGKWVQSAWNAGNYRFVALVPKTSGSKVGRVQLPGIPLNCPDITI